MQRSHPGEHRPAAWHPALALAFVAAMMTVLSLFGGVARAETTTTGAPDDGTPSTAVTSAATATTDATATTGTTGVPGSTGSEAGSGMVSAPAGFDPPNPGLLAGDMSVQFWPEYDTKDILVLLHLTLPATTAFPYTFTFYVPNGARLAGIAEVDENGDFDYSLGTPKIVPGEIMTAVTVTVPKRPQLQLEYYYDPGVGAPGDKSFPVQFQAPADVAQLSVTVQQPLEASAFSAGTALTQVFTDAQGFNSYSGTFSGVKAGDMFQTQVEYTKTDPDPSVSSAAPGGDPAQQQSSSYLLWLLIVLVLAVAGIVVYRLFIRKPVPAARAQRQASRPVSRPARAGAGQNARGGTAASRPSKKPARATPGDTPAGPSRFCTECGGKLTKKDRFCALCGAERDS